MPYYAWGAELSPDYDMRTHISGRREQFHFAGNLSFNLLPLVAALAIYIGATTGDFSSMIANFTTWSYPQIGSLWLGLFAGGVWLIMAYHLYTGWRASRTGR